MVKDYRRLRHASGTLSPFDQRYLPMDTCLQVTEMAQIKDSKATDDLTTTTNLHNNRLELLLSDHIQQIYLAKLICPEYDKDGDNWIMVNDISQSIKNAKNDIKECYKK